MGDRNRVRQSLQSCIKAYFLSTRVLRRDAQSELDNQATRTKTYQVRPEYNTQNYCMRGCEPEPPLCDVFTEVVISGRSENVILELIMVEL